MGKLNYYAIVEPYCKVDDVLSSDVVEYQNDLLQILFYTDNTDKLYNIYKKQGDKQILKFYMNDSNIHSGIEIIKCFTVSELTDSLGIDEYADTISEYEHIDTIKNILKSEGIVNAMTLFVDDAGNSRRKENLTKMIGRGNIRKLFGGTIKNSYMTVNETIKLCSILGWDIKKDLLDYMADRGVTNGLQTLKYRKQVKYGYFINQYYINILLDDNKLESHLDIKRTLQFIDAMGWDIYDDILQYSKEEGVSLTDVILNNFKGNSNPLDDLEFLLTTEQYGYIKKKFLEDLIYDIKHRGIPLSLFEIMGRGRLQRELINLHLYRRLSIILGYPVHQLSSKVKSDFLKIWKAVDI